MSWKHIVLSRAALGAASLVLLAATAVGAMVLRQAPDGHASALVLYVSASGSDANAGTQSAPFATITRAARSAGPGTVVHVAPGVYRSPNRVETGASGTASSRVRYTSDTRWGAKIVITADERAWENTGSYVDIVGFDITNTYAQGRLGLMNYGTHVRIMRNHAHHISQQTCDPLYGGAGLDDGNFSAGSNAFLGNVVDHIGPTDGSQCGAQVQGIYESSPNGLIANNIVDNVSGYGIHCWHGATAETIVNNLSFKNGISGIIVAAGGAPTIVIDNSLVANNIVVYNANGGISEYGDVGSNNRFVNNDVFGNSGGPINLVNSHNTVTGTLNVDPQFVNYQPDGGGDYHLRASSPLIGAGIRVPALTTGADGNARPQQQGYDIGPYQYVAGRVSPTATATTGSAPTATPPPATNAGYTPPDGQGLYEECRVSDRATCANELQQMASGGFTVVLNYDSNYGSASDLLAYADAAHAVGMKVIWALSDPIFWTGDALSKYSQLAATCGCSNNTDLARYVVSVVKNHPATWGYYVGDELTSSVHSQWLTYSDAIRAADASHPRLIIQSSEAQGAVSPYTSQFADGAEVIGQDYYPIGQTVYGPYTNTGNMAAGVQAVADQMHRDDAIVLQAFAWSEYNGGTLVFPTQAEMGTMLTQALASSRPRVVLWYSYFDIMRSDNPTQHWNDLVNAAKLAAQPSTPAATPTSPSRPAMAATPPIASRPVTAPPTAVPTNAPDPATPTAPVPADPPSSGGFAGASGPPSPTGTGAAPPPATGTNGSSSPTTAATATADSTAIASRPLSSDSAQADAPRRHQLNGDSGSLGSYLSELASKAGIPTTTVTLLSSIVGLAFRRWKRRRMWGM